MSIAFMTCGADARVCSAENRLGAWHFHVSNVIAFLASDDARYRTGEIIEVNGGQLML